MHTTTVTDRSPAEVSAPEAVARLRLVLRTNAATSLLTGMIALLAGPWVSRELGIDHVAGTRALGAGLVAFALGVLAIARMDPRRLLPESLLVSVADAAWVLGTVVVVAGGVLTTAGDVVAIVVALAVADFCAAQLWFRARAVARNEAG